MKKTIFEISSREDFILHKNEININERDILGHNILYYAFKDNDFEKVKWLIEEGFDLSTLNNHEEYMAIKKTRNDENLQNLLIYYGLSLFPSDDLYDNNLNKAYHSANVEILKMMIEVGNPLYIANEREDFSYILHEVKKDYKMWEYLLTLDIEEFLSKRKVNINDLDSNNETLLFRVSSIEDIDKLIELGADINAKNINKETALFNADVEKTKILIEKGINLNITNNDGMNALYPAIMEKNKEKIALLIHSGIDTNIRFYEEEIHGERLSLKENLKKHDKEIYDFIIAIEENHKLKNHLLSHENINNENISNKKRL